MSSRDAEISRLTTRAETAAAAEMQRRREVEALEQEISGLKGLLEEAREERLQAQQRVSSDREAAAADAAAASERISELQQKLSAATEAAEATRTALAQVCLMFRERICPLQVHQQFL